MILLFGVLADPQMAYVCTRLADKGVDFLVLDARLYRQQFEMTWSIEDGVIAGCISYASQQVPLSDVRSAYIRELGFPNQLGDSSLDGQGCHLARSELYGSLAAFTDTLPALVVNRSAAVGSNRSKPYQQQIIARHGFRTPRTLVTTIPEEAARFYDDCHGRVIYKSISPRRSIVKRVTSGDLARLEQIRDCPTQFQEYIAGVDIRVHTVGNRVFASEILSDATDYRYAGREGGMCVMRGIDLPVDVAECCLRLADDLGMVMSGIDLRRSPAKEYYCFEVNPSPAFTFYQVHTGQRIGDALVHVLCRGSV